jgi:hypothetical protein
MILKNKLRRSALWSLTLSAILAVASPAFGSAEEYTWDILDNSKVWQAAFKNSSEIKDGLSKFLPEMDATKLQTLFFENFGEKIFEDTVEQYSNASGSGNPPSLSFYQKFYLSDFYNFIRAHQTNKKSKITREELRPFMKVLRNESQKIHDLCAEYPLHVSTVCRTRFFLEDSIRQKGTYSNSAEMSGYHTAVKKDQAEYEDAIKALQEYRSKIEAVTGSGFKNLCSDKKVPEKLFYAEIWGR